MAKTAILNTHNLCETLMITLFPLTLDMTSQHVVEAHYVCSKG